MLAMQWNINPLSSYLLISFSLNLSFLGVKSTQYLFSNSHLVFNPLNLASKPTPPLRLLWGRLLSQTSKSLNLKHHRFLPSSSLALGFWDTTLLSASSISRWCFSVRVPLTVLSSYWFCFPRFQLQSAVVQNY